MAHIGALLFFIFYVIQPGITDVYSTWTLFGLLILYILIRNGQGFVDFNTYSKKRRALHIVEEIEITKKSICWDYDKKAPKMSTGWMMHHGFTPEDKVIDNMMEKRALLIEKNEAAKTETEEEEIPTSHSVDVEQEIPKSEDIEMGPRFSRTTSGNLIPHVD